MRRKRRERLGHARDEQRPDARGRFGRTAIPLWRIDIRLGIERDALVEFEIDGLLLGHMNEA